MYVLLINIIINDDDAGIDDYGDDDDDEKDIDEENLDPGGRRVESGAAFQGFFKSELKLDFFPPQGAALRDAAGDAGHQAERGVALLNGGRLWWRKDLTICCH